MISGLMMAAAALAAVLIVIGLIKAARRSERLTVLDWLLAILIVGLALAGLLALYPAAPDFSTSTAALWIGIGLTAASVVVLLAERRRFGRWTIGRGALGILAGLLLIAASFVVPLVIAWISLNDEPAPPLAEVTPTPGPEETLEVEGVISVERMQAELLFRAIRRVLAEEIAASEVDIFLDLDQGVPLAAIVERHGGDLDRVRLRLVQLLSEAVRASAGRGEMTMLQAALLVSQMELFVRFAVSTDLNSFRGFGGPMPTGTQPSLLTLLTSVPAEPTSGATRTPVATATPEPAAVPATPRS